MFRAHDNSLSWGYLTPMNRLFFFLFLLCNSLIAGPFSSSFDDLTSVSMTYGARDTRINPAGLAYESELNGNNLHSILNIAV